MLAAARTLPTWSDRAVPPIPSAERKAVKELQEECRQRLTEFPTTAEQDMHILGNISKRCWLVPQTFIILSEVFDRVGLIELFCGYHGAL